MISAGIKQKLIIMGFFPYGNNGEGLRLPVFNKGKKHVISIDGREIAFIYPDGVMKTYEIDTIESILEIILDEFKWLPESKKKEFKKYL